MAAWQVRASPSCPLRVHGVFAHIPHLPARAVVLQGVVTSAVHVDEEVSVDGRYGRFSLPYPDEWPLCCSPHHCFTRAFLLRCRIARRAPALGGVAGTCCSLQYPALLLSLCAWLYAHLSTYFLAAPPAAGTRAVRYSRRRHGLHGGLDGGGGEQVRAFSVQYPPAVLVLCVSVCI